MSRSNVRDIITRKVIIIKKRVPYNLYFPKKGKVSEVRELQKLEIVMRQIIKFQFFFLATSETAMKFKTNLLLIILLCCDNILIFNKL